ncbi:hypothetical protein [uncultured Methanoregula sp.]|uniref:hypothetical protein n=1 Tax=uncultured Methanoregula sp. TaxID=1005933 RepID=UPI002AAC4045|nr:hypothetical protein [uncultured Methanoregula sp.]
MNCRIKKIIFILGTPLTKKYFNNFGIEIFLSHGFDVEIWDISPFLQNEIHRKNFLQKLYDDDPIIFDKYKKFNDKQDIIHALSKINPDTVVNIMAAFNMQMLFIYDQLSRKKIKYCVLNMITHPLECPPPKKSESVGFFRCLFSAVSRLKEKHGFTMLCKAFFSIYCDPILLKYHMLNIKPADMALLSGVRSLELAYNGILIDRKTTHLIWAHSFDYDTYLNERNNQKTDPALGVFLDENVPLHPDYEYLNLKAPIGIEEYCSNLCNFFNYLENNYHVRIIIAAHPRSNYDESKDYFKGRPVTKGETARLIAESSFVVAHASGSMNFAVLFRKPILFTTMNVFQKKVPGVFFEGDYIDMMAHLLKKDPINIDTITELDWKKELEIDTNSYNKYQNDYVKKEGTPEIPCWEIYIQELAEKYPL